MTTDTKTEAASRPCPHARERQDIACPYVGCHAYPRCMDEVPRTSRGVVLYSHPLGSAQYVWLAPRPRYD